MSIYFKDKIKKEAEEQMVKEISARGYKFRGDGDDKLSKEEFDEYYKVSHIVGLTELQNEWHFYLADDVYDDIIAHTELGQHMKNAYDDPYSTEEYLEEALSDGDIQGFHYLGGDLYIIKE